METTRMSILLRIPELSKSHVKMSDPGKVCDKLRKMLEDGRNKLQVLTDFDKTLTRSRIEGFNVPILGSMFILRHLPAPKSFVIELAGLVAEYSEAVDDTSIPYDDQKRANTVGGLMDRLIKALASIPLKNNTSIAEEAVRSKHCIFRDGTSDALRMTKDHDVPFTILSAGFGDIIDALLKHKDVFFNNVHVIANHFVFKDGHIDGFVKAPVHPYNKHEHFLRSEVCAKLLKERQNILLLGDSVTDAHMTDGATDTANVLKIGFFNNAFEFEGSQEQFKEKFDVVIVEDESLDVVNGILKFLLSSKL